MTDFGRRVALHKATHADGGIDEVEATGLIGRVNYVDRGDPSSVDFDKNDITANDLPHDLDLSSIIPPGAKAVHLRLQIMGDGAALYLYFYKKGYSNNINKLQQITQTANNVIDAEGIVPLDSNRVISYLASDYVFDYIGIIVKGWFI